MKVADYLIERLVSEGLNTFFLVTGGAIVPTVDAIGRNPNAKMYCFQHEQSAAMAAEAHYRTHGKMGVVLATSGPGAQNLMNGICGCWYESIPCIFITGQVSSYESIDSIRKNPRQLGFQETDIITAFKPFTKYCNKLSDSSHIDDEISKLINSAINGRKGPTLLDIPVNFQNVEIDKSSTYNIPSLKRVIDDQLYAKMIELNQQLHQSERPLLLIGHGVRLSGAMKGIRELVDQLNIPFVVSWGGFDILPHDHPLFVGDIGVYGSRGGNYAIQNCDLLISIGSRLDTRQTGGDLKTFARGAYKVMVDVDENEINKRDGLKIDLPIISDAKLFINSWLQKSTFKKQDNSVWYGKCNKYKNIKTERKLKDDVLTSYEFLKELNNQLPEKCTIIADEGGHLVWAMQSIKPKEGHRMFSNFGNSSMGWGLPASIGAAIDNDEPVILIDGDGGFQMNIQELQTIKHYNLPVKIFIINNGCYGIIKQFQDAYFDSRYIATEKEDYSAPNFCKIANAYEIPSVIIQQNDGKRLKEQIKHALEFDGPVLVNVIIDREQKLEPKLEFGNPLEDMYPYVTDEELSKNMIIKQLPRRDNTQGWVNLKK